MKPRVVSIGAGMPFLDALADGIFERFGQGPKALPSVTVLLPTRRACAALRDAFLRRCSGKALLLPRMIPIGDVDPDSWEVDAGPGDGAAMADADELRVPPAISGLKRQFLLSQLVRRWHGGDAARAAALARELARFLDDIQTEQVSLGRIADLVPEDYAVHWQQTVSFLEILTRHWPKVLAELGVIDPVERRNRLLAAATDRWREVPSDDPVVAAGSTGSVPSTADLLAVVAELPAGHVVLPGLDRDLDQASWEAVDDTHPQFGLKVLLARLGVARDEVADWSPPPTSGRVHLLSLALRPAETTADWRCQPRPPHDVFEGFERVDCPGPQEEAGVIALKMRNALEEPGRTAALVTRDRTLARRVSAELRRWGLTVDDSAGQPLGETVVGSFLRLTAKMVGDGAAPIPLLSALKHPLAAGGRRPEEFRARVRALERAVLRGPRPAPGLDGVMAALDSGTKRDDHPDLVPWFAGLCEAVRTFAEATGEANVGIGTVTRAHLGFAEWLAASDEEDAAARLWSSETGEAAAAFFSELIEAAEALSPAPGADYPALLDMLLADRAVRPRHGGHTRLFIWGALEARLQHAELMILGGLNEGSWPPEPPADPWLSRPMRAAFGLSLPERRVGMSAHDFAQIAAAADVLMTRAEKVDGKPTVPARWLSRLETLMRGWSTGKDHYVDARSDWLGWRRGLDAPRETVAVNPPAPCPPTSARPRSLTVTEVETWMRDPYAIYARRVLGLKPLDPIDPPPGPAERGTFIHRALDRFVRDHPDELPEDACGRLLEIGRRLIAPMGDYDQVAAFWWPGFERIAAWFVAHERATRSALRGVYSEAPGKTEVTGLEDPFTLVAKADRIERTSEGSLSIVDYKTGLPPPPSQVRQGYAPQLALEAMIAEDGGFSGLAPASVTSLAYWHLSGGTPAGRVKRVLDAARRVAEARAGLTELVRRFDDPATPYHAEPRPGAAPRFSDYAHLSRVLEWSTAERDGA